jgi:iron complex transport system substrate-binding protein
MLKNLSTTTIACPRPLVFAMICVSLISTHISAGVAKKIASLSLASDEILLDLMQECGGSQRIVALSTFADDPESSSVVERAKSIKGRVHSEPESLFSLKPDLVIAASFNRSELIHMIQSRKIPLLVLDKFTSVDDIAKHIQEIGDVVDCPKEARSLNEIFLRQVKIQVAPTFNKRGGAASAAKNTEPHKRLRVINYSADMVVMGLNTLFDDLVTRAGGINVASELGLRNWPRIDVETLLSMKPDKIIVIGVDSPKVRAAIKAHPAWGRLDAVIKGNQLIFLDSKTALSTSHYFGSAISDLKKRL